MKIPLFLVLLFGSVTLCASTVQAASSEASTSRPHARVLEQRLSQIIENEGVWRGVVYGSGEVHLLLHVRQDGGPETTRYMGSVRLDDKRSTFVFKTPLPEKRRFSWRITARAF